MSEHDASPTGAACGAVFAVGLFLAASGGGYSPAREVLASVALSLAIPFVCCLGRVLRHAGTSWDWWVDSAVATGVAGILLKIASGVPDVVLHRAHLRPGTPTHDAFTAAADATTTVSLVPLALFCAATAVVVLRSRVLPTWLGAGAALTAVALVVNASVVGTEFVPALVLFLLWVLVTSLLLLRRTTAAWHRTRTEARAATA